METLAMPSYGLMSRIVRPESAAVPTEAAHYLLTLDFDPIDKERAAVLAEKADANELTESEREELNELVRWDALLGTLHSMARRTLNAPLRHGG